ncbi:hypothetical protein ScPMuIL_001088 [Solemya velum]
MASRESNDDIKPQQFDYFLVLDFEATCSRDEKPDPQEIIEFPVLKVNSRTLETESIFHQYVQPRVHPELTGFCVELTGIIQDMVDGQPHIEDVLKSFHAWMIENGLIDGSTSSVFVTCGDWDLKTMLPSQCQFFNLPMQSYFRQWINIKKPFAEAMGVYPKGMMPMLKMLGVKHQGRHHSGIDDCKNIANILCGLLRRGHVFKVTGTNQ